MNILYLIHIDWNWIFQRPQIMALMLEKDYHCCVVNKNILFSPKLSNRNTLPKTIVNLYQLPKEHKFSMIKKINKILFKHTIKDCNEFDIIWVCYPLLYDFIPSNYKGKIVYDCMDNYVAMAHPNLKSKVAIYEQELIKRSDLIFASSNHLIESVPNLNKAILLRNGFISQEIKPIQNPQLKKKYHIGYIGTISSWFDFKLLEKNIENNNNIYYHLLGPTEKGMDAQVKSTSKKIIFEGVFTHGELYSIIEDYDALIMPFIVNDTILSVDPVKLYEYVCFGKCIVSVWYPEINRFSPFIYFYRNQEEYDALIKELKKKGFPPKYNFKIQKQFLDDNTWDTRYTLVKESINALNKERTKEFK